MTARDPVPDAPSCPICHSTEHVEAHDNPHQGRFICMRDMLIFDGTTAEWATPPPREKPTDEIAHARSALKGEDTDS